MLIGGVWHRAASVGNTTSPFKPARIFALDQNSNPDHSFSVDDAAETDEARDPDGSESLINNSPERSSSTDSGAPRHTGHPETLAPSVV